MPRASQVLDRGSAIGGFAAFALTIAIGCATAEPVPEIELGGEGGAGNAGAASGGRSSGGVPGTGGSPFLQGGSNSLGGVGPTAGAFNVSGGASNSGGKSSGGTAGAGTAGSTTSAGTGGSTKGGTTGSGGSSGSVAKGGAGSAGASVGGATSGGAPGKGGTTSAGGSGAGAKGELFFDDFEMGKASRWIPSPAGTDWAVVTDGTNVYKEQTLTGSRLFTAAGDVAWADQVVEARLKIIEFAGQSTSYYAALCARVKDAGNFYSVTLSSDGKLGFRLNVNGALAKAGTVYTVPGGVTVNTWYTVRLEVRGNALSAYLNGTLAASHTVTSNPIATGGVGLATYNTIAVFDDVRVTTP